MLLEKYEQFVVGLLLMLQNDSYLPTNIYLFANFVALATDLEVL
jgi:hypothetical protein